MRLFRPGDKIICIRSNGEFIKGKVYTVFNYNSSLGQWGWDVKGTPGCIEENAYINDVNRDNKMGMIVNQKAMREQFTLVNKERRTPSWL
jgi:hypothetical protein